MFEDALFNVLINIPELTSYLTKFQEYPAVFNYSAPKSAKRPYLIFNVDGDTTDDNKVIPCTVDIDIFAYQYSGEKFKKAAFEIENTLSEIRLSNDEYSSIRFYTPSKEGKKDRNPESNHYNVQFDVRASRSGWMQQL